MPTGVIRKYEVLSFEFAICFLTSLLSTLLLLLFSELRSSDRGAVSVQTASERQQRPRSGRGGERRQQESQFQQQTAGTGETNVISTVDQEISAE